MTPLTNMISSYLSICHSFYPFFIHTHDTHSQKVEESAKKEAAAAAAAAPKSEEKKPKATAPAPASSTKPKAEKKEEEEDKGDDDGEVGQYWNVDGSSKRKRKTVETLVVEDFAERKALDIKVWKMKRTTMSHGID